MSQIIGEHDWRLYACDHETGSDHLVEWGGEMPMRKNMTRAADQGRDVWLVAPGGDKHLPTGQVLRAKASPKWAWVSMIEVVTGCWASCVHMYQRCDTCDAVTKQLLVNETTTECAECNELIENVDTARGQ